MSNKYAKMRKNDVESINTAVAFCVTQIPIDFQSRVGRCLDIGGSVPNACADVLMRLWDFQNISKVCKQKNRKVYAVAVFDTFNLKIEL